MPCTASFDDCMCVCFALGFAVYCIVYRPNKELFRHWYHILLARFYDLCAFLTRTEIFTLAIFFYLVAKDACLATLRAVQACFPDNLFAQKKLDKAEPAAIRDPAPINAQLLAWIEEDANEAWQQKREARENERVAREQERAAALWGLERWSDDEEDDEDGSA